MNKKKIMSLIIVFCLLITSLNITTMKSQAFSGGNGTTSSPYLITNQSQLLDVTNYPSSSFRLANDITLSGTFPGLCATTSTSKRFSGTFDGNYKTIYNLNMSGSTNQGLFKGTYGATIKNLNIRGGTINATGLATGSIVANATSSLRIENCTSNVNIYSKGDSGGMVGTTQGGYIIGCTYSGNISGSSYVGGIVGDGGTSSYYTYISDCRVIYPAEITDKRNRVSGTTGIGGISGGLYGSIDRCYSDVSVSGSSGVGGILGKCTGSSGTAVRDSYSNGNVSASSSSGNVGGIAGNIAGTSKYSNYVERCYATGEISSHSTSGVNIGGIAGDPGTSTTYSSVSKCFALNSSLKQNRTGGYINYISGNVSSGTNYHTGFTIYHKGVPSTSSKGTGGNLISQAQAESQTTYANAGWDFSNKWVMNQSKSKYPTLKYWSTGISGPDFLYLGQTATLPVSFGSSTDGILTAASSNTGVLTAAISGNNIIITPIKAGTAIVTVVTKNGLQQQKTITVYDRPTIGAVPTFYVGSSVTIPVKLTNVNDKIASAASSNTGILTVTVSGTNLILKGMKAGTATVTLRLGSGYTFSTSVKVEPTPTLTIHGPDEILIDTTAEYKINLSDYRDGTIQYSCDNTNVQITQNNNILIIKGIKTGEATITVKSKLVPQGTVKKIKVISPVTGIKITNKINQIGLDDTYSFTAEVMPETAENKEIIWSSNNRKLAKIDSEGNLTIVGSGLFSITAQTVDGDYADTCYMIAGDYEIMPSAYITQYGNEFTIHTSGNDLKVYAYAKGKDINTYNKMKEAGMTTITYSAKRAVFTLPETGYYTIRLAYQNGVQQFETFYIETEDFDILALQKEAMNLMDTIIMSADGTDVMDYHKWAPTQQYIALQNAITKTDITMLKNALEAFKNNIRYGTLEGGHLEASGTTITVLKGRTNNSSVNNSANIRLYIYAKGEYRTYEEFKTAERTQVTYRQSNKSFSVMEPGVYTVRIVYANDEREHLFIEVGSASDLRRAIEETKLRYDETSTIEKSDDETGVNISPDQKWVKAQDRAALKQSILTAELILNTAESDAAMEEAVVQLEDALYLFELKIQNGALGGSYLSSNGFEITVNATDGANIYLFQYAEGDYNDYYSLKNAGRQQIYWKDEVRTFAVSGPGIYTVRVAHHPDPVTNIRKEEYHKLIITETELYKLDYLVFYESEPLLQTSEGEEVLEAPFMTMQINERKGSRSPNIMLFKDIKEFYELYYIKEK